MNFWRVVEILGKRKWLILLSIVVASALTAGATHLVGSRWVGTVQLVVPQGGGVLKSSSANGDTMAETDANGGNPTASKDQIAAYLAVVRTRNVIEPVLADLGMSQIPANMFSNITITASSPRIFQLSYTDSSRDRAEKMANSIADHFVDQYQKLNSAQIEGVVTLLTGQLQSTDAKLAEARKEFDQYRSTHNINVSVANNLEMALTRLKENRQRRDGATQKLAATKAQLATVLTEKLPAMAATVLTPADPAAVQLQSDLDAAEKSLTELRSRYTDSWPEVKKAIAHRDDVKNRLQQETAKPHPIDVNRALPQDPATLRLLATNKLQEDISGAQAELSAMDAAILAAQQELDHLKGIDGAMSALTVAITEKTEMHSNLVTRLNRAQIMLDASRLQDPIAIMDKVGPFNPPVNASAGRTIKLTVLGGLCALLLTSALLVSLDSVDRRLKTVTQAEIVLPTRVVAAIPQPMGRVTYGMMSRATELQPQSLHAEAYRFFGMHVLNQPPHVRSLMMLSAKAEQGSTTSLTNLGITLAQAGKRVILVDANIRTSELHQAFDLPNETGFTDLIANFDRMPLSAALQSTSVPNLSVITSGHLPANPWELFRSPKLMELSRQLLDQADFVLYDTPSALMFTDALNLAPIVDAAYLCIRAFEPLSGGEKRVLELLDASSISLLGSILTDVPASVIEGYHNYQHYYASPANGGDSTSATMIGKNLVGAVEPSKVSSEGSTEPDANV